MFLAIREWEFIDPKHYDLPVLGFWAGATVTADVEEIIKQDPDLIIYMTDTNGEAFIDQANDVQEQTGIPVVVLDYSIETTNKVYRILGDYLGEEERAGELAVLQKNH